MPGVPAGVGPRATFIALPAAAVFTPTALAILTLEVYYRFAQTEMP